MAGMMVEVFTWKEGMYLSTLWAGDKVHIISLMDEIIEDSSTLIFCFRIAEKRLELFDHHSGYE